MSEKSDKDEAKEKNQKTNKETSENTKNTVRETSMSKSEEGSSSQTDSELEVDSDYFNPLKLLYAKDHKLTKKKTKVVYQNFAALESAYNKYGIWSLDKPHQTVSQKKPKQIDNNADVASCSGIQLVDNTIGTHRRFQAHQMPVSRQKVKPKQGQRKDFFTNMKLYQGPLGAMNKYVENKQRVRVITRNERGVRGHTDGLLIAFDKHWNLWLRNVEEVWRRRKYKYGRNNLCNSDDESDDCADRLALLGIDLPKEEVKSIDRKNVEITRKIEALMLRGENVVLVYPLPKQVT